MRTAPAANLGRLDNGLGAGVGRKPPARGSGQGLKNSHNIGIIIENAKIPVIVDAGIRTPSQASEVMEMGATAVLLNTAVAKSPDPISMARAMAKGIEGGHLAYLAGSMSTTQYAKPSSPSTGLFL